MELEKLTFDENVEGILARVPIKVDPGERIFHDPINSTHKCVVQQRSVDELMIRITDERNRT